MKQIKHKNTLSHSNHRLVYVSYVCLAELLNQVASGDILLLTL